MSYDSPKREKFTKELIKQKMTGKGTLADAYINAGYKAKTRKVARVNACKLKKHPEVQQQLKNFKDLLLKEAPPEQVAKKIAKNINTKDGRLSDSAIDKWLKIFDIYPASKHNIKYQETDQKDFWQEVKQITEQTIKTQEKDKA